MEEASPVLLIFALGGFFLYTLSSNYHRKICRGKNVYLKRMQKMALAVTGYSDDEFDIEDKVCKNQAFSEAGFQHCDDVTIPSHSPESMLLDEIKEFTEEYQHINQMKQKCLGVLNTCVDHYKTRLLKCITAGECNTVEEFKTNNNLLHEEAVSEFQQLTDASRSQPFWQSINARFRESLHEAQIQCDAAFLEKTTEDKSVCQKAMDKAEKYHNDNVMKILGKKKVPSADLRCHFDKSQRAAVKQFNKETSEFSETIKASYRTELKDKIVGSYSKYDRMNKDLRKKGCAQM